MNAAAVGDVGAAAAAAAAAACAGAAAAACAGAAAAAAASAPTPDAAVPAAPAAPPSAAATLATAVTAAVLPKRPASSVVGGNAGGNGLWRRVASALHSPPLNLSALTPTEWQRALRRLLDADHRPTATDELSPSDPFFGWVSAARCAREAYVGSGRAEVPPLRKCKLAHLCAALHVDDAGYAACIGQPLRPQ